MTLHRALRALVRLLRVLAWVLWGLGVVHTRFASWGPQRRQDEVQQWSLRMLRAMGVELLPSGTRPTSGPLLLVSNHVSWLDILVLNAARPARFVSKSDVKHWPLLGRLVAGAGTLFIERESRRDAMRVVHHMAEALQAGDVVAVFPEGTTGDGTGVLPFHANLLQAALAAHAPVQPVALAYRQPETGLPSTAPVYVGDTTLLQSIWCTLCAPEGIQAHVVYGEPQVPQGLERRALAAELRHQIQSTLGHNPGLLFSHPQTHAGATPP